MTRSDKQGCLLVAAVILVVAVFCLVTLVH